MNINNVESKVITTGQPVARTSVKEEVPDSFQKTSAPAKLDADLMRELQKTLSGTKVSDDGTKLERLERPMTEDEKVRFHEYFPVLDVDKAVVTDEATPAYNCIAWSGGITDQWIWPPSMYPNLTEDKAFDKFYASRGFKRAETGELARWSNDQGITHGSISGPGHGPRWESKCGGEARIQHGFDELQGEIYGKPDVFYTKVSEPKEMPNKLKELSANIKLGIKAKTLQVNPEIKKKFDGLYASWQAFRKDPKVTMSANPADYCKTEAFTEITKMGGSVIPLLMEKISNGDFFCLQAVGEIAKTSRGPERALALSGKEVNTSEQNKAYNALMKYYNS
ncbi:MAG: hypothetical protein ABRQ38_05135 [Candidatus Eremiobacterota bacterium]